MKDHFYELRIEGQAPQQFLTLQGAMAKAVYRRGKPGAIWYFGEFGAAPVKEVTYGHTTEFAG